MSYFVPNKDVRKHFPFVARQIGPQWTQLTNVLDCMILTRTIDADYANIYDKAMTALMDWYVRNPTHATLPVLIQALRTIFRNDIASPLIRYMHNTTCATETQV